MDIRQLHHISLPTTDLERSRQFYGEVLGLTEIQRPPFPFPGAWFRLGDRELHLIGGEGARSQGGSRDRSAAAAFRDPGGELRGGAGPVAGAGYHEDVEETDPKHLMVMLQPLTGYPQAYIADPDRHLIEINAERLEG